MFPGSSQMFPVSERLTCAR